MDLKKTISGLSPVWLIGLALAAGTTIVTLIPFSISGGDTIKSSDWIGFSGSIVGAAMTILAALIAYGAVRDQLRMDLLSREETRMENVLPSLRDTASELRDFLARIDAAETVGALVAIFKEDRTVGMRLDTRETYSRDNSAASRVPSASLQTQRSFVRSFRHAAVAITAVAKADAAIAGYKNDASLNTNPIYAEQFKGPIKFAEQARKTALEEFRLKTAGIVSLLRETETQIDKYEGRLIRFRKDIEAYFDE